MLHSKEESLLALNYKIEKMEVVREQQAKEISEKSIQNKKLIRFRNILLVLTFSLLLLLVSGIFYNFNTYNRTIKESDLASKDFVPIPTNEYNKLISLKKQLNLAESNIATNASQKNEQQTNSNAQFDKVNIKNNIVYAVQVATFKEKGIGLYSSALIQFNETIEDTIYKYSLGAFKTLKEAQKFRKEVVKMGFEDAFVGSYKNGKRLKIEDPY